ncbi:MAG TPA: hypothetical protein VFH13_05460, partial [Gemmatimonadaceae bacterium]|nr:hypothetical protein [Gemmatimonadaceae bacterium]
MRRFILLSCFLSAPHLAAQSPPPPHSQDEAPPIEDNSFLVEEAYNQERGIVQHINTFSRATSATGWMYTFTQEWPLAGQKHQLSYTVPLARKDETSGGETGLGDVAINYRYQIGGGENPFALAP